MKAFLKRLRGIIGTGLTWALGWAGLFGVAGAIFGAYSIPRLAFIGGFMGLIVGGAFAVILSITERRHSLEDLSLWRTALWGGLGGFLVAVVFSGSGGLNLVACDDNGPPRDSLQCRNCSCGKAGKSKVD